MVVLILVFVLMLVLLVLVLVVVVVGTDAATATAAAAIADGGARPAVERMSAGTAEIREVFRRPGSAETKRVAALGAGATAAAAAAELAKFRVRFFRIVRVAVNAAATAAAAAPRGMAIGFGIAPRVVIVRVETALLRCWGLGTVRRVRSGSLLFLLFLFASGMVEAAECFRSGSCLCGPKSAGRHIRPECQIHGR